MFKSCLSAVNTTSGLLLGAWWATISLLLDIARWSAAVILRFAVFLSERVRVLTLPLMIRGEFRRRGLLLELSDFFKELAYIEGKLHSGEWDFSRFKEELDWLFAAISPE